MKIKMTIAAILLSSVLFAQTKPTIAVLNIDSKGLIQDPETMGYMVRLELEKTAVYSVMDKYEVADVVKKHKIDVNNCYSKSALIDAGKKIGVDKMLSGSIERFGEKVIISLRIIDVKTETIEKTEATEYLNLQPEVQKMIEISVKKIVGITPDQNMVNMLVNYEVPIISPKSTVLNNGPRMGASFTFGDAGAILQAPKNEGGFNMYPVISQFGWQKEFQYISAGNFQALIENIFLIGGLESGRIIPSYSFMNGFRFGKAGWEFAFGPSFRIIKVADGYYDKDNKWNLMRDFRSDSTNNFATSPGYTDGDGYHTYEQISQLDNRGSLKLSTGLIIGVGRTFRSGYLNIPVNLYVSPRKEGSIVGVSIGFNIQKKKKIE